MNTANKFIENITNSAESYSNNLKYIINNISQLDFDQALILFIKIENNFAFNSVPEIGIDLFTGKRLPLISGLFGGYLIEKIIVFAKGNETVILDTLPTQLSYGQIRISKIFNHFNSLHRTKKVSCISPISTLMLPMSSEQMRIQRPPMPDLKRFYICFGKNEIINEKFKNAFDIDLNKIILLSFILYAFVLDRIKHKHIIIFFMREEFVNYLKGFSEVTEQDIDIFLESISLDRMAYSELYSLMREDQKGKHYSYDYQEHFDRSLPRINYSYPLLKQNAGYLLTSNVAFAQFLKMDRFYRMITEEISDSFKGAYVGPAIEQYARSLVDGYAKTIPESNPILSGDERYGPKKAHWKEPDVILETDKYIFFVECKANPFSLTLLKDFDSKSFNKTIESVKTSMDNINRFISHHEKRLREKKVIKILAFYECQPDWLEMLKADIDIHLQDNGMIVIDFNILECLLQNNSMSLLEIIESYEKIKSKNPSSITFEQYLNSIGNTNKSDEEIESDFLITLAREYGLATNE